MRRNVVLFVLISLVLSFPALADSFRGVPFKESTNAGALMKLTQREIKEENKRLKYTITARYPQIEEATIGGAANFNRDAKALVLTEANKFRKNIREWDATNANAEVGSYLETDYDVMIDNGHLISIAFGVDTYYNGAAHPNHNALVINYDLKANRRLTLAGLFKLRSSYLRIISNYCIADLKKQMAGDADERWIKEGAGPLLKNYRNWTITKDGLTILFDPYLVAPYAAGPQRVDIPYAALKGIIAPNGPLADVAK